MPSEEEFRQALIVHKSEIESLAAETVALQFLIVNICGLLTKARPDLQPAFLQAFDSTANVFENLSLSMGKRSAHAPKSLKVIEELRTAYIGHIAPKPENK